MKRETQVITRRLLSVALNAALFTGAAALVGCNQQPSNTNAAAPAGAMTAAATAPAPAQAAPAYTPPTADQLYQMVAPIALFPDKLVAQVLAGSTYPDQVTAADNFLEQNQSLQGAALQDAVDPQSWDPSIKGLTVFPKVLDQMAQNIPWTTALGTTYANDPTDVLNAIQVMRQRASKHGTLRSSAKLRVVDQPVAAVDTSYAAPPPDNGYDQTTYSGPDVIPPPQQTIEILPADADTVYVPQYDPQTVYGDEVQAYPTYSYDEPGYSRGDLVTTGAIAFGAGIVIASLFEHHHHDRPSYGWNSWDMQWRGNRDRDERDHGGRDNQDRWQRPAVVHNNTVYETRSTTINNHYVINNINNSVNNSNNRTTINRPAAPTIQRDQRPAAAPAPVPPNRIAHVNIPSQLPMSRPNFNGALSKGEPARFAHAGEHAGNGPGTPVVAHKPDEARRGDFGMPGVSAPGANRPGMPHVMPTAVDSRHARVNMPGVSAPAANRPGLSRIQPTGQPNRPGQRGESMRIPGQHIFTAAPTPAPHTAAPVARPTQHVSPAAPRSVPATRPQAELRQHEFPRAAPMQSQRSAPARQPARTLPIAAPQPREAPRQQPQREIARPQMPMAAPQRREAPRQQPQPQREVARPQIQQVRAMPRPQMAPRPAAEQHRSAPAQNEHPKKDEKQH